MPRLPYPETPYVTLHESGRWRVTEHPGGLYVELLFKAGAERFYQGQGRSFWAAPSVFIQAEEASEFVADLRATKKRHPRKLVDALLLDPYADTATFD